MLLHFVCRFYFRNSVRQLLNDTLFLVALHLIHLWTQFFIQKPLANSSCISDTTVSRYASSCNVTIVSGYSAFSLFIISLFSSKFVWICRKWKNFQNVIIKGKGKAVPLQAWSGPEGSKKLGFQISWQRHRMVVGCQPYAPAAFTPRKCSWYSFLLVAELTPGP